MLELPPLSYPITREFRWPWFHVAGYAAIVISIPLLVVLNFALTGYQDITRLNIDYNATQSLWYDGFIPGSKQGSLCDPYILTLGDVFVTNYNIFKWTVTSISTKSGNDTVHLSGVEYKSQPLVCESQALDLTANLHSFSVSMNAFVECITPDFSMSLATTFLASSMGLPGTVLSGQILNDNSQRPAQATNFLLTAAGTEVLTSMVGIAGDRRNLGVIAFSAYGLPYVCTRDSDGHPYPPDCIEDTPPHILASVGLVGAPTGRLYETVTGEKALPFFNATIGNVFQTLHAAVRLDFGPTLYNNFLTNATVAPLAIAGAYPVLDFNSNGTVGATTYANSSLYEAIMGTFASFNTTDKAFLALPLDDSQKSTIQVPYLCHFTVRKSMGPLIISVLVATLSMFSAGWGVSMLVASYFATRNLPEANYCYGHRDFEARYRPVGTEDKMEESDSNRAEDGFSLRGNLED